MRPTADETLQGADRLLRTVLSEDEVSPATAGSLEMVLLMLKQARAGWSTRLPFLTVDNHRMLGLLVDVAPDLPAPLAAEVTERSLLMPQGPSLDVQEADELNVSLRALLAQAVQELAMTHTAHRERIREYLLQRVTLEPG